jgi:lambda family phage portal protein
MFERLRAQIDSVREAAARVVDVVRGTSNGPATVGIDALSPFYSGDFGVEQHYLTGNKFSGGFGSTQIFTLDYWTLRARSRQLFTTNLYARGLIRRLVTNEIAVGLHLEATPSEKLLGKPDDALADWAEDVENRFALWQADPWLCDAREEMTFGALQIQARMEALIEGDVLIVLRQFQSTQLPRVQLILGSSVQSPMYTTNLPKGATIKHGVQLDAQGRQVGYWVNQPDGTSKYIPAYGEKSGRRIAWLVYGTEKKLDDVRGQPMLSLVLQSMREIDRYRDSTQRKAVINSMLAMFVQKTVDTKIGSRPFSMGATKKGIVDTTGAEPVAPRKFNVAGLIPGLVLDELNPGEEPKAFPANGTDEKFGEFERAIIQAIAWAHEIPPEILMLSFNSNYSASQAALNEFKIYLNKVRTAFGDTLCTPIYVEWLIGMSLAGKINAPELLESWRDPKLWDVYAAWTSCDWSGNIKPSVDPVTMAEGYEKLISMGGMTRDRMARETTGSKFSQNVKKLRLENEALVRANLPLLALDPKAIAAKATADNADGITAPANSRGGLRVAADDIDHESIDEEHEGPRPLRLLS